MVLKTTAWTNAAGSVFSQLYNCQFTIFTPPEKDAYDPATDSWTYTAETVVWSGAGRVQVLRSGERSVAPGDDSETQMYQFQKALPMVAITDEMQVRVTDGGNDPTLVGRKFYLKEVWNSGGSFEQTFYATTNSGRP